MQEPKEETVTLEMQELGKVKLLGLGKGGLKADNYRETRRVVSTRVI